LRDLEREREEIKGRDREIERKLDVQRDREKD